jgi:hypothetical protein
MSASKTQTRFLIKASALMIALLVAWWFVLLNPLLFLLRGCGQIAIGITEAPSGEWNLRIPLEFTVPAEGGTPASQVHSIDFSIARADVIAFTFSLPVFWAIALAAPGLRRNLRALLWGTLATAAMEIALLLLYAEITARNAAVQLTHAPDGLGKWFLHFGEYMVVSVIPYAAPFVIAIALHRELRREIFSWGSAPAPVPAAEPPRPGKQKRKRDDRPARRA